LLQKNIYISANRALLHHLVHLLKWCTSSSKISHREVKKERKRKEMTFVKILLISLSY